MRTGTCKSCEKLLNAANISLGFSAKVTCMIINLFFLILFFQPIMNSNFSTKFYILWKYLNLLVISYYKSIQSKNDTNFFFTFSGW